MSEMQPGADPKDHTVEEVNAYLATADQAERDRVLAAEQSGKNRATVAAPSSEAGADTTDKSAETDQAGAGTPAEASNAVDTSKPTWYEETNGPVPEDQRDQYNVVPNPNAGAVAYSDQEQAAQQASSAGQAAAEPASDASAAEGASSQGGSSTI